MRPACYGSFTPQRRTPCAICAERGPCASKTDFKGFTIMPTPRYGRKHVRTVVMPDVDGSALAAEVLSRMTAEGFQVSTAKVFSGRQPHRIVVAIVGSDGARVEVAFPNVTAERMRDVRSATRCEVRARMLTAKDPKVRTLRAVREAHRSREVGCVAICSTPEDAVALINEVASAVFRGRR